MDAFLDIILSNFVILAAVIGGVFSFIKSISNKEKENQPEKVPNASPSSQQASVEESHPESTGVERLEEYYSRLKNESNEDRDRFTTFQKQSSKIMEENTPRPDQRKPVNRSGFLGDMNSKKLAQGFLMSEILGPPRAHKPHQSYLAKTKMKSK